MISLIYTFFNQNRQRRAEILKVMAHISCLAPISMFAGRELARLHSGQDLAVVALSYTGRVSIWLLIISLVITPLNILFGWKKLLPLRKPIGLYSFFYASLHLLLYATFDMGWDLEKLWLDLQLRPAAQLGSASLFILFILTLTSFPLPMRILGKRWKKLHRTVYVAAILAVSHWILASQLASPLPVLALTLLSLLLLIRANLIKSWVVGLRRNKNMPRLHDDSPVIS